MPLECQSHKFSMDANVRYLNCAYLSPLLKSVEEAGVMELKRRKNPINYGLDDFFGPMHEVKTLFSMLINAQDAERIAIIPSASYGLANAANNLLPKNGGNIVLLEGQFPSNYYIWKKKADKTRMSTNVVHKPKNASWSKEVINSINSRTSTVVMCQVHWADGSLFDLKAIGEKCKKVGALFIVDGTQSIGAFPFDVKEIGADAVICAGYKWLLGPYGIGLAYYGEFFDNGSAIEENWLPKLKSDQFSGLTEYQEDHRPKAWKFNVGESSNFIYLKMLIASLKQILEWDVSEIQNYCKSISVEAIQKMLDLGCEIGSIEERSGHLFGVLPPPDFDRKKFSTILKEKNVFISQRGDYYRISPNVYNSSADLFALKDCFEACIN